MIPIFVITCDRLEVLKNSIQSYRDCIKTPFEIVIIDFGSSYEPTVEFLKDLECNGVKVYWKGRINYPKGLNCIDGFIRDYFKYHPKSNYIVTDPDVALDNVEGDVLNVYGYLLEYVPKVSVVGPVLRIDDIPDHYPKKKEMIKHERPGSRFNSAEVKTIQYKGKTVRYSPAAIDTTFGMYRAEGHFQTHSRRKMGIRVLSPYSARHLEWYLNPKNLTQDQKYYVEHASWKIIHWGVRENQAK